MEAYGRNYMFNHLDHLADCFPLVKSILGDSNFKFFAHRYLLSHPPEKANIELWGDQFSNFLKNRNELVDQPLIADYGSLEWMWHQRFCNPDPIRMRQGVLENWKKFQEDETFYPFELSSQRMIQIALEKEGNEFLFILRQG